ncbi:C-type lectin domain family 10 member A-like [Ylistrum balloti]|uniref:C-type lectin domain family 10 member A-like n=1 Tax=Ylistrum balloti TaxID=509963 RepID=UPI002905BCDC|nr:C-type lectin domain family 10 member A-like [Ylistrum balloti]
MTGLALTTFVLLIHACSACTGGWHSFHHGGPCFKVFHESGISWNQANSRCRGMGTVLAQVSDHSTHTHLINLISSDYSSGFFMIGATNWHGSWTWNNLGSSLPYGDTYWLPGQPDNYCAPHHTCHEGQHCVAYTNKNGHGHWGWDDITCSVDNYDGYICEKNADGYSGPLVG